MINILETLLCFFIFLFSFWLLTENLNLSFTIDPEIIISAKILYVEDHLKNYPLTGVELKEFESESKAFQYPCKKPHKITVKRMVNATIKYISVC